MSAESLDFGVYEKPIDIEGLFFDPKHPGIRRAAILIFSKVFDFSVGNEDKHSVAGLIELVEESFRGCENKDILDAFIAIGDYHRAWESHTLDIEGGSRETPEEALERAVNLVQNIPGVQNFIDESVAA